VKPFAGIVVLLLSTLTKIDLGRARDSRELHGAAKHTACRHQSG
jgi:hypothetical protein